MKTFQAAIGLALVWTWSRIAGFAKDTRAVSTVEYALIVVAVIAIVGVAAGLLNDAFTDLFTGLATEMNGAVNATKAEVS